LVNEYVLDPAHIVPSRSDANSNGHFPLSSSHMQSGTPRGFNLANPLYFNANGAMAAGGFQGVPAANFPGFMGVNQASWAGNGLVPGDASGLHQPGVMRRGGGRYNNRSGPYDRRGNRSGAGGANAANGRLSPVRSMPGMFGAGGRFPANAAGAAYIPPGHPAAGFVPAGGFPDAMGAGGGVQQAMGPREAVQGRSLKSYEDLDAVGGAGSGELNY
jgi:hypothetical protein